MSDLAAEQLLRTEIKHLSDSQPMARAAMFNASLRSGRALQKEGLDIIGANINLFVMCQNELMSRVNRRI